MENINLELSRDTPIRRYLSFQRLESLIKDKEIHFTRFDNFDDYLEGGVNRENFISISNSLGVLDLAVNSLPGASTRSGPEQDELQHASTALNEQTFPSLFGDQKKVNGEAFLQQVPTWLYANCWTGLEHECQAMWQLYGSSGSSCRHDAHCEECAKTLGNSVCIETTVGALVDNLVLNTDYNLSVRKVEYIDHRSISFDKADMIIRPFFAKALHFKYENEVRFMLWPNRKDIKFSYKYKESTVNQDSHVCLGLRNIESFINKVILSPMPPAQASRIRKEHTKKYGSTLGLSGALSNKALRDKVLNLLKTEDLNIQVDDSALNQAPVNDIYSYMETMTQPGHG